MNHPVVAAFHKVCSRLYPTAAEWISANFLSKGTVVNVLFEDDALGCRDYSSIPVCSDVTAAMLDQTNRLPV